MESTCAAKQHTNNSTTKIYFAKEVVVADKLDQYYGSKTACSTLSSPSLARVFSGAIYVRI